MILFDKIFFSDRICTIYKQIKHQLTKINSFLIPHLLLLTSYLLLSSASCFFNKNIFYNNKKILYISFEFTVHFAGYEIFHFGSLYIIH